MTSVSTLLPRVKRMANGYRAVLWNPADREDLAQEGALGLLEAAARYETGRGAGLGTYATARARGAMLDHVRSLARHGREIPACGVDEDRDPWDPRCDESRSPESRVMLRRFRGFLQGPGAALQGIEADVVRLRFREGRSVREVAAELNTSPPTVLRIERRALDRLRTAFVNS
jgi:RNA polymerase sigma factor (sigma-70 family)